MFYLSVVFLVIAFAEIKNSTDNHCKIPHESLINRSVPEISLIKALSINLHHKPRTSRANPKKFPHYFMLYLLVLANDIELNPGPRAPKYPCGVCQKAVTWKHKAICCDTCNTWFHTQCESIRDTIYDTMQNSNTSWNCLKCQISVVHFLITTTLNILKTYISTSQIQMIIPFNFRQHQLG